MPTPIAQSGIAAQAFRLLEMQPISSLGDDSEQAISAADQYPEALGICLEYGEWSFARRPAQLAQVAEASGDPDLAHVFQRPADFVKMLEVRPACIAWRVDADRIRTDDPGPIFIRYTAMVEDETRLSSLFRTAVAYRLASLLAPRWTTSINRSQALHEASEQYLRDAARSDRAAQSSRRHDGRDRQPDWAEVAVAPGRTAAAR